MKKTAENECYLLCCCRQHNNCPTSVRVSMAHGLHGFCLGICQHKIDQYGENRDEMMKIERDGKKRVAVCVFGRLYVLKWKLVNL